MRWAWAIALGLVAGVSLAAAKPPELPVDPQSVGRVPVYPDGEMYREPQLEEAPGQPLKQVPGRKTEMGLLAGPFLDQFNWLRAVLEALPPQMNLLLPPIEL